jgi:hypothetical protein
VPERPPVLFLLIDAIPFDLAWEAWDQGAMPGFGEPRPSVSVFPSLTDVAVPALLRCVGGERPPGYEARWYHPPSGEIRGPGDPASEAAVAPFQGRPRGVLAQAALYLLRSSLAYAQVRWITHRFAREGGPWLGYLSATDGVAHFDGRVGLRRAFDRVVSSVDAARREHRRRTGVWPDAVLCSDHGMAFGRLHHLPQHELAAHLEAGGFRPGARGPDGVVLVPWGEVGGGVAYVDPARAPELAARIAAAPGVDLAFGIAPGGGLVFRSDGARARLAWRDDGYGYESLAGDPLGYGPVLASLAAAGLLESGLAPDGPLFAASWSHPYPDALARVRRGLEDLVLHPAPVLFSMREDWTYGPALTHAGAMLLGGQVGTHGALSAAQSLGFATASEERGDPWNGAPALRAEQVFAPWRALLDRGLARQGPDDGDAAPP